MKLSWRVKWAVFRWTFKRAASSSLTKRLPLELWYRCRETKLVSGPPAACITLYFQWTADHKFCLVRLKQICYRVVRSLLQAHVLYRVKETAWIDKVGRLPLAPSPWLYVMAKRPGKQICQKTNSMYTHFIMFSFDREIMIFQSLNKILSLLCVISVVKRKWCSLYLNIYHLYIRNQCFLSRCKTHDIDATVRWCLV